LSNLIVFDLDGVITSEEAYWDAAGLTLHELMYSPRYWNLGAASEYHPAATAEESRCISRAIFPESELLALKARAINSNWDTCYITVCLHLIDLLARLPDLPALLPLQPWDAQWTAAFRTQITGVISNPFTSYVFGTWRPQGSPLHFPQESTGFDMKGQSGKPASGLAIFESALFQGYVGLELINRLDEYASEVLDHPIIGVFSRHSAFWAFCQDVFQEWYLGDELYMSEYGHAPAQRGKPGCVHFERPLLPAELLRTTLETLRQQGYVLGFATGRSWREAETPLEMQGLLSFFAEAHISTYDYVERAEAELRATGDQTLLSKPHPFPFLMALDQSLDKSGYLPSRQGSYYQFAGMQRGSASQGDFVVVGDSTSDILGGRAAGALTVAVLTGARTAEARTLLAKSEPDFTIEDITKLPALLAHIDSLATIQRLQFNERAKAEQLLRRWFARHMHLTTDSVTLMPRAVSLNSFNGFYQSDGQEFFFKTHVEEQGVLEEYYHAELLHQAGYNIVKPLRTLHQEGQQMVIYPVVRWPVMFDLVRAVETGTADDVTLEMLVAAEQQECHHLLSIYRSTLACSAAQEHAHAPVHQLFWHRLAGGRFKSFYEGKHVRIPGGKDTQESALLFDELLRYRWIINGVAQQRTLGELVERAKVVLDPARAAMTVIGHGDAHFGNVFLEQGLQGDRKGRPYISHPGQPGAPPTDTGLRYLYFDPAFAGRHTPLLDLVKPLFHNVFAMWMYFPYDIARDLNMSVVVGNSTIIVEHNYALTPIRQEILQTKIEHLLVPLIEELRSQDALPTEWPEIIQLALMCCPLLTINLLDGERLPPPICWLGLAQAVQTGNKGIQLWRIDS
jgi:phosphoglycolate phosphatase-like HAD superfamily hydrolase